MTLPSGKYFQDDVQYFASGPEFPYANTQAATQRARMQAAGHARPAAAGRPRCPGLRRQRHGPRRDAGRSRCRRIAAIPKLGPAPEAENAMPGGPSAPNPAVPPPVPNGAAPGGSTPPPPQ